MQGDMVAWGENGHTRWLLHGGGNNLTLAPKVSSNQHENGKVVSHGHEINLGRCYFSNVQSANDEDFQKFSLLYFCEVTSGGHPHLSSREMTKLSHLDMRWLSVRCYFGSVQSANGEDSQKFSCMYFCKVISHGHPHLASMQNDKIVSRGCKVTTLVRCYLGNLQSANNEDFQKFSLYTFAKSPCMTTPTCLTIPTSHPWERKKQRIIMSYKNLQCTRY